MSWYERRALALQTAATLDGWDCVRLPGERHIGRMLLFKKGVWARGLHPVGSSTYAAINHMIAAQQRARTKELPK